ENLRSYFVDYAPRHRHSACVEIAAWVRAHGEGKTTYMVGSAPGFYIRHGAIQYLTYGYATRDIETLDSFVAAQRFDPARSLFVIMPHGPPILPQLEQAVGPFDLQPHRSRTGEIAFLTAIPRGNDEPLDPADRFDQPRDPGPGIATLDTVLRAVSTAAEWLLGASGAALLVLALVGWGGRPPRPGLSALPVPGRERAERWRRRVAGPGDGGPRRG